jgi:hypothetical protein
MTTLARVRLFDATKKAPRSEKKERQAEPETLTLTGLAAQVPKHELLSCRNLCASREILPKPLGLLGLHVDLSPAHILLKSP